MEAIFSDIFEKFSISMYNPDFDQKAKFFKIKNHVFHFLYLKTMFSIKKIGLLIKCPNNTYFNCQH